MLRIPVTSLKGIGRAKSDLLKSEAGVETIEDLLYYSPRKYLDRSSIKKISDTAVDEEVTVSGTILTLQIVPGKKRILKVVISDGSESLTGIFFAGISYFQKIFSPGEFVLFSGKISIFKGKQITHPDFDFLEDNSEYKSINTGRIIPLYPSTEALKKSGLDSRGLRRIVRYALDHYKDHLTDPIDQKTLEKYNLISLSDAVPGIHFPESIEHIEKCRLRLAFNEIFFLQYYMAASKKHLSSLSKNTGYYYDLKPASDFINSLPFELTNDQKKAFDEISEDLKSGRPMNRLLQGDVGTGKTVVALASALIPVSARRQSAIMVPTEILAHQHYRTALGLLPDTINCSLLTGSMKRKEKEIIYQSVEDGTTDIIIGTHALIQEGLKFKDLAYIIIDEQHRFGVRQRGILRNKGQAADLLIMTATPIPRSLSMTIYADMDLSFLRTPPSGREEIETLSFPESRLKGVYNSIDKYISQGRQIFYVLPLIEESEKIDLKSAEMTYIKLKNEVFPHRNIALIHGKIPQSEKDEIMNQFRNGVINILVATTVIEVGIDIQNVNVIVIEHAERFGLAQIHQLRGRVGRGSHKSFCILVYPDNISASSKERIDIITHNSDGFAIAELDLKLRGTGELTGTKQHGSSDFEFLDLGKDLEIIKAAKYEAEKKLEEQNVINPEITDINQQISGFLSEIRSKRVLAILS